VFLPNKTPPSPTLPRKGGGSEATRCEFARVSGT
jgi:hypothetical protein